MPQKRIWLVRSIIPIPTWETLKQCRQASTTTSPISQQNLALMVQEMVRRGCRGVGSIHRAEITAKEGRFRTKHLQKFLKSDMLKLIT